MSIKIREALRQFGTDEVDHFGRPLTEHLLETSRWLEDWGNSAAVYMAGAFHSIYGTEEFKAKTLPLERRTDVRTLIGAEAEELVYLFCVTDRKAFFEQPDAGPFEVLFPSQGRRSEIDRPTLSALLEIEAANIVDAAIHQPGAPAWATPWWLARFESKAIFLSEGAKADCRKVLTSGGHSCN